MRLPYGISTYDVRDNEGNVTSTKYSLDVSFDGIKGASGDMSEANPKIKDFYNKLRELNSKLIKHAGSSDNAFNWLGDPEADENVAKVMLRDHIKLPKDKTTGRSTD